MATNDIAVSYDVVNELASFMNVAVVDLVEMTATVKGKVSELLSTDGGLWLQHSSSAMDTAYENFNTSLNSSIAAIAEFGKQYQNVCDSLANVDVQISDSITGATTSDSTDETSK